jgi:amicyanin
MIRRVLTACAVGLLAFLGLASPALAETHPITIAQYAYQSPSMTVRIGDVVTWTNQDEAPHDVVTPAGPVAFRSPMLATGQSWSFTFIEPGTYSYYCSIHPDMRAEIVVLPADPEPTQPEAQPQQQADPVAEQQAPPAAQPEQTTTAAQAPTTTGQAVTALPAAPTQPPLDPMLLLAGLVAGVTTLCLLLIGSRPDNG